ncbi:ABC transporter permease subunit [Roseiflexus sp.]
MRCIRLLYIMARWELMRTLYERGLVQRLVLPHIIFLIWIVANEVFLPWILQTHQVMLGLILVSSGMLILPRVADSFAGEGERSTLEVLLLSPVPDWILVAGKTMALLAIATLSFVTALCVYGIATVLFISSAPPVIWDAMALLIGLTALLTPITHRFYHRLDADRSAAAHIALSFATSLSPDHCRDLRACHVL